LNERVFRLAQLVAGGQLAEKSVIDGASETALLLGLAREETKATIRSAMKAGYRVPRAPSRARARTRGLGISLLTRITLLTASQRLRKVIRISQIVLVTRLAG